MASSSTLYILCLAFGYIAASLSTDKLENYLKVWDTCNVDGKFSIAELRQKPVDDLNEDELCLLKCLYKSLDIIEEDGNFNVEKYEENAKVLDDEAAIESLVGCVKGVSQPVIECKDVIPISKCEEALFHIN